MDIITFQQPFVQNMKWGPFIFDCRHPQQRRISEESGSGRTKSCRPPPAWRQLHAATSVDKCSVKDDQAPLDYSKWLDMPPPRTKFTSITYKDKLVVFGGGFKKAFHGDLYEYSFTFRKWTCIQQDASLVGGPCHRRSHKVVRNGNEMVLFGGRDLNGRRNDTYTLNLDTYRWTSHTNSLVRPRERAAHSAVFWRNKMIIFGGDQDSITVAYLHDLWELNLETYQWKELKPSGDLPSGRLGHDCCMSGDNMYLFGGYQGKALDDMHVLNLGTGVWRHIDHSLRDVGVCPTSFLCMTGLPTDSRSKKRQVTNNCSSDRAADWPFTPTDDAEGLCASLLFWGGAFTDTNNTYTDTLYRYDVASESFDIIEVTGNKPSARLGHAMAYHNSKLYLFGGCDSTYYNDMYELDLEPPSLKQVLRCYIHSESIPYKEEEDT
eukprot:TRINITY_DN6604_c3_g1_i2.p1 TRINITY_DN6604_c3_g1~~TRINITY_DN6604_c3_g1_i2.p1  ORF type:complete len:434 (+),score=50.19 TRINITY_DN6604_c3_g1_i2:62-1363(+)